MIPKPSRRRVVMVCDDYIIDRRIIRECHTLVDHGWDPVVIAFNPGRAEKASWEEGVPVLHLREDSSGPLRRYYLDDDPGLTPALAANPIVHGVWGQAVRAGRWVKRRGLIPRGWRRRQLKIALGIVFLPVLLLALPFLLIERRRRGRLAQRNQRLQGLREYTRFHIAEPAAATIMYYEPDLIIAHDLPMLAPGALAAELAGVPLIYDSHELYTEIHTLAPKTAQRLKKIEADLIKLPAAVFTVNEFIAQELAKAYGVPEPGVLYNCTTLPADWSPPYDLIRQKLGLGPEKKVVLFHGWFAPGRNIEHLVDAFALLPLEYVLVLLGFGDYGAELVARAQAAGCAERVFLLAAVPQTEVLYYVASADLGVVPYAPIDRNSYFCSPNKLFDFLLCQVPVLGYDSPFLVKTLFGQGVGISAKLDSPEAFRHAIIEALEPSRYASMKQRLAEIGPRYDWKMEGQKLVEAVEGLFA